MNALVHADYQGVGGVLVEKYPDRLVFANPGSLLVSPEQLMRGSVSECRNKALQTMFLMMGAAEKAGSGMDKIRSGWESQHWRQPLVQELAQPDRVRWVLPMVSLLPEASLERLRGLFGTRFESCSKLEVQALVTAEVEGLVDNLRLQQITGSHSRDVTALLQALVARDMLLQEGRGRWTRYRLPAAADVACSVANDSSCVHKGEHSVHSVPADSAYKPDSSAHSESAESERQMLERLAAPARHRLRLAPQEMESLILQLCSDRWLTRRALADLLQRNADSLRSRFLTPMVEHGLLRMRYPDTPNRRDQAYSTALTVE